MLLKEAQSKRASKLSRRGPGLMLISQRELPLPPLYFLACAGLGASKEAQPGLEGSNRRWFAKGLTALNAIPAEVTETRRAFVQTVPHGGGDLLKTALHARPPLKFATK
jgi:hypothetical protein